MYYSLTKNLTLLAEGSHVKSTGQGDVGSNQRDDRQHRRLPRLLRGCQATFWSWLTFSRLRKCVGGLRAVDAFFVGRDARRTPQRARLCVATQEALAAPRLALMALRAKFS